MKQSMNNSVLILPLIIFLLIASCSSEKYISNWNDNYIIVDGDPSDWEGKLRFIENERAAVGVYNDNENLYLCLTAENKEKAIYLLNLGITIWLRPKSSDAKTFGIKYPLRSEDFDKGIMIDILGEVAQENYIRTLLHDFDDKQTDIQIVNDDNYLLYTYKINNGSGIEIELGMHMHQFVYEMGIPLRGNEMNEFKLDLSPDDDFGVRFLTNKYQRPKDESGKRRTGTDGRTGVPGAGVYGIPEPIDVQANVTLVNAP